jgi:large subunit ribosomal protein L23
MRDDTIVKKPIITEKTMRLAQAGWFTFAVGARAKKNQIKTVVERLFKVKVLAVRTSRWPKGKKALVKLAPGQTIDLFVQEKDEKAKK